jgi:hypothetical protein
VEEIILAKYGIRNLLSFLYSVQDLKAHFRGSKYVNEVLKLLPEKPDPILIQQIFKEITIIGKINTD